MTKPEPDHVTMLQMSGTVPFRCPRCGYIVHGDPGATIACPACYGRGFFTKERDQVYGPAITKPRPEPNPDSNPESGPKSGPGPGSILQFHRDEGPESG